MSIIDDLRAALPGVVDFAAAEFGDIITVYRLVQASRGDNSVTPAFTIESTLVNIKATLITPEKAAKQNLFGFTGTCSMFVLIPSLANGVPVIRNGDGIKVTGGPYTGKTFVAEADGALDTIGLELGVSLINAPTKAVMA